MSRLVIAIVVGIVTAIGMVALTENMLAGDLNGTPADASLHKYGSR